MLYGLVKEPGQWCLAFVPASDLTVWEIGCLDNGKSVFVIAVFLFTRQFPYY